MESQPPLVCPVPPKPFNHVLYSTISMVLGFVYFPAIAAVVLSGDRGGGLGFTVIAGFFAPFTYLLFYAFRLIRHGIITRGKAPGATPLEIAFYLFLQLCLIFFFMLVGILVTASVAQDEFKAISEEAAVSSASAAE